MLLNVAEIQGRRGLLREPARRRFLQITAGGACVGLMARTATQISFPESAFAQSTLTPDAALARLMAGNKRFADGKVTSHGQDLAIARQHTVEKQEPFAAVLACADSRVPVELIFDQSIGDIFVARVAGNFITPDIIASLEYGVAELGVKVVVVMGHAGCGAVTATMKHEEVPGQISSLYPHIQPAVDQAGGNLEAAIKANAKIQSTLLRESSTVIAASVKANKLKVAAAYYALSSGNVMLL